MKRITVAISKEVEEGLRRLPEEGLLAHAFDIRMRARKGLQSSVMDFAAMLESHMLPGDMVEVNGRRIALRHVYTRSGEATFLTLDGQKITNHRGFICGDFDWPYDPLPIADFRWIRDNAAAILAAVVELNRQEAEKDSAWIRVEEGG